MRPSKFHSQIDLLIVEYAADVKNGMEIKKCFYIYAGFTDTFGLDILTFCRVRHSNQIKLQCILLE